MNNITIELKGRRGTGKSLLLNQLIKTLIKLKIDYTITGEHELKLAVLTEGQKFDLLRKQ